MELYLKNNDLITKKEWFNIINNLKKEVDNFKKNNISNKNRNKNIDLLNNIKEINSKEKNLYGNSYDIGIDETININDINVIKDIKYYLNNLFININLFDKLKESIINAILKRADYAIKNNLRIGLFFSGGIDSSLIAFILKKNNIPFNLYTIGFQEKSTKMPDDIVFSKIAAKELKVTKNHKIKIFNEDEIKELFKETALILGDDASVLGLGVGGVEVAAFKIAKEDNINFFFGGLGSEEIYAGYERHEINIDNLDEACWNGLLSMYERDLVRDYKIAESLSFFIGTPFLDKEVIFYSMLIPDSFKIGTLRINNMKKNYKKLILRLISLDMGLPESIAFRPKKAAQYGSRLDHALEKIAKKDGLRKADYVNNLIK